MGIDARVLFRNKGKALTEREVLRKAYELATAIGHEKFFISDGNEGYSGHHALSIIAPQEPGTEYADSADDGKIMWEQDGPTIYAEDGEQFIEVHLWSRYYGPGYERGDWPTIRAVVEFGMLQGWEAWYGGDSSGVLTEKMDEVGLRELNELFLKSGHRPYQTGFGALSRGASCECPRCLEPMYNVGGGGGETFFSCGGCGKKAVVGKETRWLAKDEDWFGRKESKE